MKLTDSRAVFFVSDTHWGHANVINYSRRPFHNVENMDATLIRNWNRVIGPDDVVFHLGDFAFLGAPEMVKLLDQLQGKIHLVMGNHDKVIRHNKDLQRRFASVQDVLEVKVKDEDADAGWQPIFLSHYAHMTWPRSHHGSWQLFGHSHGSLRVSDHSRQMDVGVDATRLYEPISYNAVKHEMKKKTWKAVDHHGE